MSLEVLRTPSVENTTILQPCAGVEECGPIETKTAKQ